MSIEQTIKCRNIKAYPSVNSPNDGDFHAEQNTKQFLKSITTKPFIIGETTEDVLNSFNYIERDLDNPDNMIMTTGMFSAGGYVFRISDSDADNFDKPLTGDVMSIDSRDLKDYVCDMTNYNTSAELNVVPADFLFSEYNPDSVGDSSASINAYFEALETAFIEKTCVGYVPFLHTGKFFSRISLNHRYGISSVTDVSYGDTDIDVRWYNTSTVTTSSTADQIRASMIVGVGNPYAVVPTDSNVLIVYPVFIKKVKFVNIYTDTKVCFQFTDIFGTTYSFMRTDVRTKPYPYTQNNLTDVDSNAPLASMSFDDCAMKTLPNNIYDWTKLYVYDEYENYYYRANDSIVPQAFIDSFVVPIPSGKTILDIMDSGVPLFTKVTIPDIKTYIPDSIDEMTVDNDLAYYCLNNVPDNLKYSFQNKNGDTVRVPVAFMASNGMLCVDGFVGTGNDDRFPVEGYVHFIKRQYVIDNPDVSIDDVTLTTLTNWDGFTTLYNTYLAKPMSAYMHICYSSVLENTMYTNDTSKAFKSCGCGSALAGVAGVSSDDFTSSFDYSHTSYYLSQLGELAGIQTTTEVTYKKDKTSDRHKFVNLHNTFDFIEPLGNDSPVNGFAYTRAVKNLNNTDTVPDYPAVDTEDPMFFVGYGLKRGNGKSVENIQMYSLGVESGQVVLNPVQISYGLDVMVPYVDNGVISTLYIDESLMPSFDNDPDVDFLPPYDYDYMPYIYFDANIVKIGDKSIPSMAHGISLGFPTYSWKFSMMDYAKLQFDDHGYLAGEDFENPQNYIGLSISPDYVDENALALHTVETSSLITNAAYGIETLYTAHDIFEASVRRRESAIHTSKIYGDNYKSIEDLIEEYVEKNGSGIDPSIITGINNRITTIENIIEYPYSIPENGTISDRLKDLETAVGMPYTNEINISTRVSNAEADIVAKYNAIMNLINETQCVWVRIAIQGSYADTVLYGNDRLLIGVGNGTGEHAHFSGYSQIPAETTLCVTIPTLASTNTLKIGPIGDTSINTLLTLEQPTSATRSVPSLNGIDFWYTIQAQFSNNRWIVKMYIRNNRDTTYDFTGIYGIRICGKYGEKPSENQVIFDESWLSAEFIPNDELPDDEPIWHEPTNQ